MPKSHAILTAPGQASPFILAISPLAARAFAGLTGRPIVGSEKGKEAPIASFHRCGPGCTQGAGCVLCRVLASRGLCMSCAFACKTNLIWGEFTPFAAARAALPVLVEPSPPVSPRARACSVLLGSRAPPCMNSGGSAPSCSGLPVSLLLPSSPPSSESGQLRTRQEALSSKRVSPPRLPSFPSLLLPRSIAFPSACFLSASSSLPKKFQLLQHSENRRPILLISSRLVSAAQLSTLLAKAFIQRLHVE